MSVILSKVGERSDLAIAARDFSTSLAARPVCDKVRDACNKLLEEVPNEVASLVISLFREDNPFTVLPVT